MKLCASFFGVLMVFKIYIIKSCKCCHFENTKGFGFCHTDEKLRKHKYTKIWS